MRTLLAALAVYHGANGLVMLAAPEAWYHAVPGVTATGPANIHFIRDIGLGFLAAAAALALAARRGAPAGLLAPACVFLVGHAGLHVVEMVVDGAAWGPALRDSALIVVPALLPLAAYRRLREREGAGSKEVSPGATVRRGGFVTRLHPRPIDFPRAWSSRANA